MRFSIVVAMIVFCMSSVLGAQCEGKTLTGARCKREADTGSRFCIGHADQAKAVKSKVESDKAQKGKELDNGQCWAVTQAGQRCKHHKDGASDYCKQHAANVKVASSPAQCRAMTYEGKQCTRKPDAGYNYCSQHRK